MRLIRPKDTATPRTRGGRVPSRRQWERIWPKYVELACGHNADINDRSAIVIKVFQGVEVHCDKCDAFSRIVRNMTRREYLGIPYVETPDTPLF